MRVRAHHHPAPAVTASTTASMRRRTTGLNLLQRQCIVALSLRNSGCKREPVMPSAPLEPASFKRGPGGRPTRQEAERRHHNLLAAAARLFLEKGWDGASVDEIAPASAGGAHLILARDPDKAALFAGAFERFIEEQIGILRIFEPMPEDVEAGLCA